MSGRHRKNPLEWDLRGEWDGVVIQVNGQWIRYLDRNGEHKDVIDKAEAVLPMPFT